MVLAAVMPLTRTRHFPMLAFPPGLSGVPGYNAASYRVAEQLVWQGYRPAISRWRQRTLGLPRPRLGGHFGRVGTAALPVINGFSEQIVPRPPDWGGGCACDWLLVPRGGGVGSAGGAAGLS